MSLSATLRRCAEDYAQGTGLSANEADYSYSELASMAPRLSELASGRGSGPLRLAILAERDIPYYAAVFSCVCLGWTYVPLNGGWPVERIRRILDRARPDLLIVDAGAKVKFASLWNGDALGGVGVLHIAYANGDWRIEPIREPLGGASERPDDRFMYIMFTSGSTGEPKGVPITFTNVESYLKGISAFHVFTPEDVFIQAVELTFDLSVHDMMLCWSNGGKLVSVPTGAAAFAPRFIRRYEVTSALMVPSAAAQCKINGLLARNPMPSLKVSFFCGEPLSGALAKSWGEAAPNAIVYNIYGPTEATIAFSAFRFDPALHAGLATLPLGEPIGDQRMALSDRGEIMLSGSQLAPCYLHDPDLTAEKFPVIDGRRWYLTGDRGDQDVAYGYLYRGRLDGQIKLRGYRVELGDIEAQLRSAAGTDLAAVVPADEAGPSSYNDVVAFVCGAGADEAETSRRLRELLPAYMLPSRILSVASMPRNSNGKIDRNALAKRLAQGQVEAEVTD